MHIAILLQCINTCAYYRRVDTLAFSPVAFVGRELRLLWPEDDAWFLGTAAGFDAASGKHKVQLSVWYQDILSTCWHSQVKSATS